MFYELCSVFRAYPRWRLLLYVAVRLYTGTETLAAVRPKGSWNTYPPKKTLFYSKLNIFTTSNNFGLMNICR